VRPKEIAILAWVWLRIQNFHRLTLVETAPPVLFETFPLLLMIRRPFTPRGEFYFVLLIKRPISGAAWQAGTKPPAPMIGSSAIIQDNPEAEEPISLREPPGFTGC
jgi:hypothetical protein